MMVMITRKEQKDPAYAEKLERYRSKMRRHAPVADPQRSLLASKRKRDESGKFIKEEPPGRRANARVGEANDDDDDDDDDAVSNSTTDATGVMTPPKNEKKTQRHSASGQLFA